MPSAASDPTSVSLLQRARLNDQQAWRQLVELYGPLVHRWCKRAELDDTDVEDVFQETFRSVSKYLSSFKPNRSIGSFRSWLRTIVRTKVADHFRRLNQQPKAQGGTDAQQRLVNVIDPMAEEADDEAVEDNAVVVQRAMEFIEPEFSHQSWAAFQHVVIEGHGTADVAERLDMSVQAVRQANYRIRRRLRLVLQDLVE